MAIQKQQIVDPIWASPSWPDHLPGAAEMRLAYGDIADELVVLFDTSLHGDAVFIWVATPDFDYAAIKVEMETAEVIGVMVYPLRAFAVKLHPSWSEAADAIPPSHIAEHVVKEIFALYQRYGIEPVFDDRSS